MNTKRKAGFILGLFIFMSGLVVGTLTPVPVSTVLSGVDYLVVYAWNSTSQGFMAYMPGVIQDFTTMVPGQQGYWVYSNENATVQINGTEISASDYGASLKTGWNLVGYAKSSPGTLSTLLSGIDYLVAYSWNSTSQGFMAYMPGVIQDFTTMEAGKGYWVYANANATWTYT